MKFLSPRFVKMIKHRHLLVVILLICALLAVNGAPLTPTLHDIVESGDLETLRDLLDDGANANEESLI